VKVLVVLAQPPLPEGEAPARCAVGLIRGLKANGVEVRTLAAKQDYALPGPPPGDLDVEIVDVLPQGGGWLSLRPLRRPRGELAAPAFKARLAALAADVDVVHLEETQTACAARDVRKPSVVHLHYLVRRDRTFGVPWRRQFRDVLEFHLAERGALGRHRFLAASSPLVADAVRRAAPHAEVTLAPLTLDPLYYEPAPLDELPRAGLIGTAAWTPTAAAVERLVERVWPLVRRELPDAQLRIAGRGMRELHLHGPGIEVLGEVRSAAEFLRSLSVLLYPLERGSGVKVKVLESIASGLPVVTTPAGAEGIDGGDGVLIEDSDAALAHAAAAILRDEEDRRRRGAAALQAFGERYTPEVATRPLVALYERMARR
jgi:glycosyltransferase involved in cell wall biosynthesis